MLYELGDQNQKKKERMIETPLKGFASIVWLPNVLRPHIEAKTFRSFTNSSSSSPRMVLLQLFNATYTQSQRQFFL